MTKTHVLGEWVLRERACYVESFEAARAARGDAELAAFLPPRSHPGFLPILREMVRVDLEWRGARGDRRRLDAYRAEFPDLFAAPDGLAAVAAEEFRLRQEAGESPDPAEYVRRFGV